MSEADKLRATVVNEAKAELSPFIEASKVVFDKSLELAVNVLENSDRIAGGALVLASLGGALVSLMALGPSIGDPQVLRPLFGDTPRAIQVIVCAYSYATFGYLNVIGKNMAARRHLLDLEGWEPGLV